MGGITGSQADSALVYTDLCAASLLSLLLLQVAAVPVVSGGPMASQYAASAAVNSTSHFLVCPLELLVADVLAVRTLDEVGRAVAS